MARLTNTAPPRLLASEMIALDADGVVGLLTLETDDGTFEFAVNRGVSRELMELLMEFLIGPDREEGDGAK